MHSEEVVYTNYDYRKFESVEKQPFSVLQSILQN